MSDWSHRQTPQCHFRSHRQACQTWCTGTLLGILAMWPKMALRRLTMWSITHRPLRIYQISSKSKKLFVDGRTDGHFTPILLGRLLEVDLKMETRHPVEIYFGREFPAMCYHSGVLAARSRQDWNIFEIFLRSLEKRPRMTKKIFKILFGKFTSRHQSTLLCAKFVKIVQREIGEIVRYSCDQKN